MGVLYTENKGQVRIVVTRTSKRVVLLFAAGLQGVDLPLSNGLSYRMADEVGFPRRKRAEPGRSGKGAAARSLRRADDSSHGVVTQEGLDVARYISEMTTQFEAMAIAARLDLLAYFLGMARAESELFIRTNAVAEAESEDEGSSAEPEYHQPDGNNSFD